MLRNIGAAVMGLIVGSMVNMALILLNAYVLFPIPEGMDMANPEQMNAYVETLPVAALLVVLAAHLGQAFVGGWVAARLSGAMPMLLAMIVGVLTLAGGVLNWMSIPGPSWMMVEFPLYLVVAAVAGSIEVRRRAS